MVGLHHQAVVADRRDGVEHLERRHGDALPEGVGGHIDDGPVWIFWRAEGARHLARQLDARLLAEAEEVESTCTRSPAELLGDHRVPTLFERISTCVVVIGPCALKSQFLIVVGGLPLAFWKLTMPVSLQWSIGVTSPWSSAAGHGDQFHHRAGSYWLVTAVAF